MSRAKSPFLKHVDFLSRFQRAGHYKMPLQMKTCKLHCKFTCQTRASTPVFVKAPERPEAFGKKRRAMRNASQFDHAGHCKMPLQMKGCKFHCKFTCETRARTPVFVKAPKRREAFRQKRIAMRIASRFHRAGHCKMPLQMKGCKFH